MQSSRLLRRVRSTLVVLLVVALPLSAGAQGFADRLDYRLLLGGGGVLLHDGLSSAQDQAAIDSSARALTYGLGGGVRLDRRYGLSLDLGRGTTTVDAVGVTPRIADITWWRFRLRASWAVPLAVPGLDRLELGLGYARERWASSRQRPTQLSPSWGHHDLLVGAAAGMRFVDQRLGALARLDFVPFEAASDDFTDNGDRSFALGLELALAVDWDFGKVLGPAGSLGAGAQLEWGGRWLRHSGAGTRVIPGTSQPVRDVAEDFNRLGFGLFVIWRFPGDAAAVGGGAGAGEGMIVSLGDEVRGGADREEEVAAADEAKVDGNSVRIQNRILFKTGSAEIDMAVSKRALRSVASLLKGSRAIKRLEVQGHTDDLGTAAANTSLSQKRAEAVVRALVDLGVARERLVAKGYGATVPLAANDTEEHRAKNRRVEFRILD